MTANTRKNFAILFVIVILSTVLSACSNTPQSMVAGAFSNSGDAPASISTVHYSERVDGKCDMSSTQGIINAITADVQNTKEGELNITTDAWLDAHMNAFACIAPKPAK